MCEMVSTPSKSANGSFSFHSVQARGNDFRVAGASVHAGAGYTVAAPELKSCRGICPGCPPSSHAPDSVTRSICDNYVDLTHVSDDVLLVQRVESY